MPLPAAPPSWNDPLFLLFSFVVLSILSQGTIFPGVFSELSYSSSGDAARPVWVPILHSMKYIHVSLCLELTYKLQHDRTMLTLCSPAAPSFPWHWGMIQKTFVKLLLKTLKGPRSLSCWMKINFRIMEWRVCLVLYEGYFTNKHVGDTGYFTKCVVLVPHVQKMLGFIKQHW